MKVIEIGEPLFKVYKDQYTNGFYAISDIGSPSFCIHAPSLQTLGLRVKAAYESYEKLTKKLAKVK